MGRHQPGEGDCFLPTQPLARRAQFAEAGRAQGSLGSCQSPVKVHLSRRDALSACLAHERIDHPDQDGGNVGLVQPAGNFAEAGERLGQGRDNVRQILKDRPELFATIDTKLRAAFGTPETPAQRRPAEAETRQLPPLLSRAQSA